MERYKGFGKENMGSHVTYKNRWDGLHDEFLDKDPIGMRSQTDRSNDYSTEQRLNMKRKALLEVVARISLCRTMLHSLNAKFLCNV